MTDNSPHLPGVGSGTFAQVSGAERSLVDCERKLLDTRATMENILPELKAIARVLRDRRESQLARWVNRESLKLDECLGRTRIFPLDL